MAPGDTVFFVRMDDHRHCVVNMGELMPDGSRRVLVSFFKEQVSGGNAREGGSATGAQESGGRGWTVRPKCEGARGGRRQQSS